MSECSRPGGSGRKDIKATSYPGKANLAVMVKQSQDTEVHDLGHNQK